MEAKWSAPWNPSIPIETYLAGLEDVYTQSVRHPPSYTIPQMIGKAIDAITVSGVMPNHVFEWVGFDPANQTWDELRTHFGEGYGHLLIAGTGVPQQVGVANNAIENGVVDAEDLHDDDEDLSLTSVLGGLQTARPRSRRTAPSPR